jgi:hypothetical protein
MGAGALSCRGARFCFMVRYGAMFLWCITIETAKRADATLGCAFLHRIHFRTNCSERILGSGSYSLSPSAIVTYRWPKAVLASTSVGR